MEQNGKASTDDSLGIWTEGYEELHAWVEAVTGPADAPESHIGPREGDPCCARRCDERLHEDQPAFGVHELEPKDANPGRTVAWVCWRHCQPTPLAI